ncbi:hypothetical protein LTR37_016607 [Vermiconidia calcicola]|uniref:Uncharacterized protein n=1 Tax=Vermiconidia calcicola TaxID=1690605 RepID=A0ACC3MME3_9PEZI|nr:hypothetical protein LTR37_016607 [Vermiconidia calcicola]
MAEPRDNFSYRTLPDSYIRLIRFRPEKEKDVQDRLNLSIEHYAREDAPSYVALSYEWGETSDGYVISIDGKAFGVWRNLWWALIFVSRFHRCEYMWVDAICINQEEVIERNHQVRDMGQIYANASTVLVWIGQGSDTKLAEEYRYGHNTTCTEEEPEDSLLYSSYWSRTWIIKELLLARNVELLWRSRVFTWQSFCERTYDLVVRTKLVSLGLWREHLLWAERVYTSPILSHSRLRNPSANEYKRWSRRVLDMLSYYQNSECKDERDKIFAILGVLDEEDRYVLEHIFPNYFMPPQRVQLLTLAYLVMKHGSALGQHSIFHQTRSLAPASLGLPSREDLDHLLSKARSITQLRPYKRPHFWTIEILTWTLLCNGLTQARRARKVELARTKREWLDEAAHELQLISASTVL